MKTDQDNDITIKIARSKCTGCGTCTMIAPAIFELDDNLTSRVKRNLSKKDLKSVKKAANNCLSGAIKLIQKD